MARPFFVFLSSLFILIAIQILLEDYFNVFDAILGPLDESEDSKSFQVRPHFINSNVVSDEQLVDYMMQKAKQMTVARTYVRKYVNALRHQGATVDVDMISLKDVFRDMNYNREDHLYLLNLLFAEEDGDKYRVKQRQRQVADNHVAGAAVGA